MADQTITINADTPKINQEDDRFQHFYPEFSISYLTTYSKYDSGKKEIKLSGSSNR